MTFLNNLPGDAENAPTNVIVKKVLRYYSECGRGFWKKQKAVTHNINCKCWKNPRHQTCLSCKHFRMVIESEEGQSWEYNGCDHSDKGIPVHENAQEIRKNCPYYESKR